MNEWASGIIGSPSFGSYRLADRCHAGIARVLFAAPARANRTQNAGTGPGRRRNDARSRDGVQHRATGVARAFRTRMGDDRIEHARSCRAIRRVRTHCHIASSNGPALLPWSHRRASVGPGKGRRESTTRWHCQLSCADPLSSGVYLETASPDSLEFYYCCGFALAGEGDIDGSPLWCLFRPD